jgi:hypothetical protein
MQLMRFSIFVLFISLSYFANGQLIQQDGRIYNQIVAEISSMPGDSGNHYSDPTLAELTNWNVAINNLLAGNYSLAASFANSLNYDLIELTDTFLTPNRIYYVLKNNGSNYWGTYVYYPNYERALVIQSPHAKNDANTGHQGAYVFRESKSMFYMLSGTHRCNSSVYAPCSGTTTGCSGSSEPYRNSDMSHTVSSIFQKTTEIIATNYSATHFIQLHGFTKLSSDPYVILSNGTQVTPSPDYMSAFANNLYNEDTVLTFKIAHIDLSWTRLRGFWNTQSRMINFSTNACSNNATTSQGRFFHVEQERQRLRQTVSGWNKIANALINTFPAISLPVRYESINASWANDKALISWRTASELNTTRYEVERSIDNLNFEKLGIVLASENNSLQKDYSFTDYTARQLLVKNIYYRLRQFDIDGKSSLSKTIVLQNTFSGIHYTVSPNPSSGIFNFNTLKEIKRITVLNHLGQVVKSSVVKNENIKTINLSSYHPGVYFLLLEDKKCEQHNLKISIL